MRPPWFSSRSRRYTINCYTILPPYPPFRLPTTPSYNSVYTSPSFRHSYGHGAGQSTPVTGKSPHCDVQHGLPGVLFVCFSACLFSLPCGLCRSPSVCVCHVIHPVRCETCPGRSPHYLLLVEWRRNVLSLFTV